MIENWATISGFEDYSVSDLGRIASHKFNKTRIMKACLVTGGYLGVLLCKNGKAHGKLVHSLVLETFSGSRPNGHESNHKDGNKGNNAKNNLEWVTPSENVKHALKNGFRVPARGEANSLSKLKNGEVWLIRKLSKAGTTGILISKMFKISRPQVSRIINNQNW